jgi:hypothetical protein
MIQPHTLRPLVSVNLLVTTVRCRQFQLLGLPMLSGKLLDCAVSSDNRQLLPWRLAWETVSHAAGLANSLVELGLVGNGHDHVTHGCGRDFI